MTHASNTHSRHDETGTDRTQNETGTDRRQNEPDTHRTQNETGKHVTQNESGKHGTQIETGAHGAQNETGSHRTYGGPGPHHRTHEGPESHNGRVVVTKDGLPAWLDPVVHAVETVEPLQLSRFLPPENGAGRQSAVLILFGEGARGPELLLMERASSLRSHAGQPSFPGGALDPQDGDPKADGPLRAALREAEEETGLDPSGVQLFGVLPKLYIPVSGFVVTPVLGWWREPTPVGVVDPAETARVFTVPVADLTNPAHRATTVHPSGHRGPAFLVESALVWGFTAGIIDRLLHYAGWELPWDRENQVPLDWRA